jgi:hypothetical protein
MARACGASFASQARTRNKNCDQISESKFFKEKQGKFEENFIEERRHFLEEFLIRTSYSFNLWGSVETVLFCKNSSSSFLKLLKTVQKPTIAYIRETYVEAFQNLSGYEINTQLVVKIARFLDLIKKFKAIMATEFEKIKEFFDSRSSQNESAFDFLSEIIPKYEEEVLLEYLENSSSVFHQLSSSEEHMKNRIAIVKSKKWPNKIIKGIERKIARKPA